MDSGLSMALLALKKEFVSLDQLIAGFLSWTEHSQVAFDEILIQCEALTKSQRNALSRSLEQGKKDGVGDWDKLINDQVVVIPAVRALIMLAKKNNAPKHINHLLEEGLTHLLLNKSTKTASPLKSDKSSPEIDPYATIDGHVSSRSVESADPYDTWNRTSDPS